MAQAVISLLNRGGVAPLVGFLAVSSAVSWGLMVVTTVNHTVTDAWDPVAENAYLKSIGCDPIFNGHGVIDTLYDVKKFGPAAKSVDH